MFCKVYLLGCLQEKPYLMMDEQGGYITTIVVTRDQEANSIYRIFIYGDAALRMRQYGFVGLHLWIEGDFQNNGEIIAEKVCFLDCEKEDKDESRSILDCQRIH